jgi:hypothetical protein
LSDLFVDQWTTAADYNSNYLDQDLDLANFISLAVIVLASINK